VRSVSDVRQTEIKKGELLVSESSPFECQVPIESLKGYKSLSVHQNSAELISSRK
jgi:hypothetical protein